MDELKFFQIEVLGDLDNEDRCVLHNFVHGIEQEAWRARSGEPLRPVWPEDARIYLTEDDRSPRLGSFVGNVDSMFIVSNSFRRLIEDHCVGTPIEYLPLTIFDPRNRKLSSEHHLVNPLGTFDCLDYDKTDMSWDEHEPERVSRVGDIILDRQKVAHAPQLFRPKDWPHAYIIGRQLARAMYDADLTNIMWTQLPFNT